METSFEDHMAVYEYAAAHDMAYVWEHTCIREVQTRTAARSVSGGAGCNSPRAAGRFVVLE